VSYHYGITWCSNPACSCGRPGKPCHEWMGYYPRWGRYDPKDKDTMPFRWCPRCGWERSDHKPLIHKGRKP
jgi:hypothetical protein